jgi:Sulfatase
MVLVEQGMYDRTLLVVTADHGMSFRPGDYGGRVATPASADQVLWVPLFVKQPGQRQGRVTDRNWEHVDLVPTRAALLGIRVSWRLDGVSQAGTVAPRTRTDKWFFSAPGRRQWFFSAPGRRQRFDGPENLARALRGVTDRLVRPGHGYRGWFQTGHFADLGGRRPGEVGADSAPAGAARVDDLGALGRVDLESGTVPAQVAGRVSLAAGIPARPAVAVAVNRVIGGVSETFRPQRDGTAGQAAGPPDRFSAMVLDTLFVQGSNRLELLVVDTRGGQVRLRPLTVG